MTDKITPNRLKTERKHMRELRADYYAARKAMLSTPKAPAHPGSAYRGLRW